MQAIITIGEADPILSEVFGIDISSEGVDISFRYNLRPGYLSAPLDGVLREVSARTGEYTYGSLSVQQRLSILEIPFVLSQRVISPTGEIHYSWLYLLKTKKRTVGRVPFGRKAAC